MAFDHLLPTSVQQQNIYLLVFKMTKYEDWTLLTFKIKVFAFAIFIVDIKINK